MRKRAGVLSVALVVVGVFVGLQPASSQPGATTLTFFDPNATDFEKSVNVGRKGFSAADWAVLKDRFLDPETCDGAGVFLARFTFVKSSGRNDGFFLLDAGILLPDGKLTIYWPGRFSDFQNADPARGGAVTGGTGAYAGSGGTISVEEDVRMCDRRGALVTVELVR
jgi:hypothetical protein